MSELFPILTPNGSLMTSIPFAPTPLRASSCAWILLERISIPVPILLDPSAPVPSISIVPLMALTLVLYMSTPSPTISIKSYDVPEGANS